MLYNHSKQCESSERTASHFYLIVTGSAYLSCLGKLSDIVLVCCDDRSFATTLYMMLDSYFLCRDDNVTRVIRFLTWEREPLVSGMYII